MCEEFISTLDVRTTSTCSPASNFSLQQMRFKCESAQFAPDAVGERDCFLEELPAPLGLPLLGDGLGQQLGPREVLAPVHTHVHPRHAQAAAAPGDTLHFDAAAYKNR